MFTGLRLAGAEGFTVAEARGLHERRFWAVLRPMLRAMHDQPDISSTTVSYFLVKSLEIVVVRSKMLAIPKLPRQLEKRWKCLCREIRSVRLSVPTLVR